MMAEKEQTQAGSPPVLSTSDEKGIRKQPTCPDLPKQEEDEIDRLERRIREVEEAKAKKKAEKRARKSGIFMPAASPSVPGSEVGRDTLSKLVGNETATPTKLPAIRKGMKADRSASASPAFCFSPNSSTPKKKDFTATMERLKAAEKAALKEEIRKQDLDSAS